MGGRELFFAPGEMGSRRLAPANVCAAARVDAAVPEDITQFKSMIEQVRVAVTRRALASLKIFLGQPLSAQCLILSRSGCDGDRQGLRGSNGAPL